MSASYGIDKDELVVWLDSAPALDPALAGSLCRRHADALTVPKGWRIDDRREEVPRLFRVVDDAVSVPAQREHTPSGGVRKRSGKSAAQASLFDAKVDVEIDRESMTINPDADPDPIDESERQTSDFEETRAIPWMPRLVGRGVDAAESAADSDTSDDPEIPSDATPPQGRLLRRAFGDRNVR